MIPRSIIFVISTASKIRFIVLMEPFSMNIWELATTKTMSNALEVEKDIKDHYQSLIPNLIIMTRSIKMDTMLLQSLINITYLIMNMNSIIILALLMILMVLLQSIMILMSLLITIRMGLLIMIRMEVLIKSLMSLRHIILIPTKSPEVMVVSEEIPHSSMGLEQGSGKKMGSEEDSVIKKYEEVGKRVMPL